MHIPSISSKPSTQTHSKNPIRLRHRVLHIQSHICNSHSSRSSTTNRSQMSFQFSILNELGINSHACTMSPVAYVALLTGTFITTVKVDAVRFDVAVVEIESTFIQICNIGLDWDNITINRKPWSSYPHKILHSQQTPSHIHNCMSQRCSRNVCFADIHQCLLCIHQCLNDMK
jgi:hypothetical protein